MADIVDIQYVENPAGIQHVFRAWDGPTGQYLDRRLRVLQTKAVATAPIDTGRLKSRITVKETHRGKELEGMVGTNPGVAGVTGYGYWQHEGVKPHDIKPVRAKALRFMMNGTVVYLARVRHPGFAATRYLTRWLREAVK